jgi:hypothetical protein
VNNENATSSEVRELVVEAVASSAELMAIPAVRDRWESNSALDGMSVGALAAHLVRAAGATIAYLDRTPENVVPDKPLLTPVTYFHAAVDSPIHDEIKKVSLAESSIGHEATVEKCLALVVELKDRFSTEPESRLVGALGGRLLTLDDFCRTRLIEVLFHLDDLANSVDVPTPDTNRLGRSIVIEVLIGIGRNNYGDWAVLHGLARAERSKTKVFPIF